MDRSCYIDENNLQPHAVLIEDVENLRPLSLTKQRNTFEKPAQDIRVQAPNQRRAIFFYLLTNTERNAKLQ